MVAQTSFEDDEPPEFLPGLLGEIELPETGLTEIGLSKASRIQSLSEDLMFDWSKSSVDARIDPRDDFKVRWRGFLECKENGEFHLHAFVAGRIRISLDEREVLNETSTQPQWLQSEAIDLKFGRHAIDVEYETKGLSQSWRLGLYWSGPQFDLEPISHRYFSHRAADTVASTFERGNELSRALRCSACHLGNDLREPITAPALTHLDDNLRRSWLIERLKANATEDSNAIASTQRMPHFGLSENDASAIADVLFDESQEPIAIKPYSKPKPSKPKKDEVPPRDPSIDAGRTAFLSKGCLACHQVNELGETSLFDGGHLSSIAAKRTVNFFARWLEKPASVNADHRMPEFNLQPLERADLAMFLQSLGHASNEPNASDRSEEKPKKPEANRGKQLIAEHRCGACHQLPKKLDSDLKRIAIGATSDWERGCLQAANAKQRTPGFQLSQEDRNALKAFLLNSNKDALAHADGRQTLREHNCVRCHSRDAEVGLAKTLAKLASSEPTLAPQLAALAPPSLTGVGDKLHETALLEILTGSAPARRPWLSIQMPKFHLTDSEKKSLIENLIAHDRIPELRTAPPKLPSGKAVELAAARLVTSEGFGCQSCHQIGSAEPPKVAINAHGTDLTMIGDRVRPSWFKRWVHNPSRIVPRMEMPAIQMAAKGVLNDDLDLQLEALWKTLNTKGFEPPKPNPVRVVRNFNLEGELEPAHVLTDVLETPERKFLRPLIVGLPNRHNILFDLESGQLASWWVGDTARQYTRGKSWYWEAGASPMVEQAKYLQQFAVLDSSNKLWQPATSEQFIVQFDSLSHVDSGIEWLGRVELRCEQESKTVGLFQRIVSTEIGVQITTRLEQLNAFGPGSTVLIEAPPNVLTAEDVAGVTAILNENATAAWTSTDNLLKLDDRTIHLTTADSGQSAEWIMALETNLPPDRIQPLSPPLPVSPVVKLDVVPGYNAVQLPLPRDEMPTALAWRDSGEMYVASLKGRALQILDSDQDGLGDRFSVISDDLPAPYGLAVNANSLDILCKTSLIRLTPNTYTHRAEAIWNQVVVADGWGYTSDYHDWAVGLVRDPDGGYYIALPCQQDDRSPAAAKLRGQALKLVPYQSAETSRSYRIESVSAGLRFPMGLALSREGDLFATDNQGNYNPFNELNHLQFGKRYGFINKLEAKPGFAPAFESPAVNLPHPWTRSVNGLCFLETPKERASEGQATAFGPFEGDLIGCEYNGLSLIRMSLQKVNGQFQGAAYMFSRTPAKDEATFEGPVCCAVSPDGALYVGSIHDSGWGGGQNTGSIVRLQPDGELPLGIDEVRATPFGFEIVFTQPVEPKLAVNKTNYNIRSYRRVSTPAYGGDDQDEQSETTEKVSLSDDCKTASVTLKDLREGCVYEINIDAVGNTPSPLFPSQAHYNMRSVPKE